MNTRTVLLLPAACCLLSISTLATAGELVSITDPEPYTVHSVGFELARDAEVSVEAVGIQPRRWDDLVVYAWILDSATREPVWVMKRRDTDRLERSRVLRKAETRVDLKRGRYELYMCTGIYGQAGTVHVDLGGLSKLGQLFGGHSWRDSDDRDDDWDDDRWDDDRWDDDDRADRRRDLERERDRLERERDRLERDRDRYDRDDDRYDRDDDRYDRDRDDERDDTDDIIIRKKGKSGRVYRLYGDDHKWDRDDLVEDHIDRCYVKLTADAIGAGDLRRFEVTGGLDDALVRFNKLGDGAFHRQGFRLSRPTTLRVHSVLEYPRGSYGPADFAWIVNADTRETVWYPRKRDTRRAGGNSKNRMVDVEVELGAGSYILYAGTDDSHSFEEWNVRPPYDPAGWGVALLPGPGFDRAAFSTFDPPDAGAALLRHDRAEDYDRFEQPFRLDRDAKLVVAALGEFDESDDEFVDHGYIADARTGEPVWTMTRRNTMPGGGASKNRRFEGTVALAAGDYVAVYVTDDSHSYEEWNAGAPFEPEAWGMAIYPGPATSPGVFHKVARADLPRDPDILVQMVRVGDHARERQRFTLDQETRIHIHALGEGIGGRMYDYGYIADDESGRVVWEMEYRDTRRAGGARKNRLYDDEIRLPAGTYKAVFRTDGSHSFEDWNDAQPREPWNWGMTIRRVR